MNERKSNIKLIEKTQVSAIKNLKTAEYSPYPSLHHDLAENGQPWTYHILRSLMSDTLVTYSSISIKVSRNTSYITIQGSWTENWKFCCSLGMTPLSRNGHSDPFLRQCCLFFFEKNNYFFYFYR
jgi:hypothetical protein